MTVAEFKRRWDANETRYLARSILHGPGVTFARFWPLWTLNIALLIVVTLLITWKGWSLPRFGMASLLYLGTAIGGYLLLSPWLTARRNPDLCVQQLKAVERHLGNDPSEAGDFLSALKAIQSPLSGETEANRKYAARLYQRASGIKTGSLPIASLGPNSGTESLPSPSAAPSNPA